MANMLASMGFYDNKSTIEYTLSNSCANCYNYDNRTGISCIDIGVNYTIEFKIGSNILYLNDNNLDNKEFIDLLKMSSKAIICKSDIDLFNLPRGAIFIT